jgi:hypothetical protein
MVAPKTEKKDSRGTRFHARDKARPDGTSPFFYEEVDLEVYSATAMLLIRVIIAKVEKIERIRQILRAIPIPQREQAGWNCVSWVREALEMLDADEEALGTRKLDWNAVRAAAMAYCGEKISSGRFNGTTQSQGFDLGRPPTFDLLENKEIQP